MWKRKQGFSEEELQYEADSLRHAPSFGETAVSSGLRTRGGSVHVMPSMAFAFSGFRRLSESSRRQMALVSQLESDPGFQDGSFL